MIVLPQKSSFAVNDTLCISFLVSSQKVISSSAVMVQGRNLPLMFIHVRFDIRNSCRYHASHASSSGSV